MVGGISGGYPTYGPHSDNQLTPFQEAMLQNASQYMQSIAINLEFQGPLAVNAHMVDLAKSCIQSLLNGKPPPSPTLASQCNQLLEDLNKVSQDIESGNSNKCLTDTANSIRTINSMLQ